MNAVLRTLVTCLLAAHAVCDIYLHNPKGSNNKLTETSNNVKNDNRLFNSQNNGRGGYQIGDACEPACRKARGNGNYNRDMKGSAEGQLTFYEGTELDIEYTAQHGCGGNSNVNCQIIIQYACGEEMRDGTTFNAPPIEADAQDDYTYAMHEPYEDLLKCYRRERNKNLFAADQNIRNDKGAMSTRQNRQGTRYGWECQEERDYYPYWHPTIWKDIAVLTDQKSMCPYYQSNSENVQGRGECVGGDLEEMSNSQLPNNAATCFKEEYTWIERDAHGVAPPYCGPPAFLRDNHLGNTVGGKPAVYKWTVPHGVTGNCAIRIRYNISTYDHSPQGDWGLDSKLNKAERPYMRDDYSADFIGFTDIKQADDTTPVIADFLERDAVLKMATNTNQLGRTFQDRTHTFKVLQRPKELRDATIHNLNVRGRRGNIVQVYPAVEYDFVPAHLTVLKGDYIHFQWTDTDAADTNNAGNGLDGSGRSNIVELHNSTLGANIPTWHSTSLMFTDEGGSPDLERIVFFSMLGQEGCEFDTEKINLKDEDNVLNCATLNRAPSTVNGGLVKMNTVGKHAYMSSRNNDFSNRSQKGLIEVLTELVAAGQAAAVNKVSEERTAAVLVTLAVLTLLLIVYFLVGTYARANAHKQWSQNKIVKKIFRVPAMPLLVKSGWWLSFGRFPEGFDKDKLEADLASLVGTDVGHIEVVCVDHEAKKIQIGIKGKKAERRSIDLKDRVPDALRANGWDVIGVVPTVQEIIPPESERTTNKKWRWIKLLICAQLLLFFWGVISNRSIYVKHGNMWLPLAKGAGVALNFMLVLLPIPTLKVLLGSLRGTPAAEFIDLDAALGFHKLIANMVLALALVHITAHVLDMEWFMNRHCARPYCTDSECECVPGHWGLSYGEQLRLISGWTGLVVTVLFAIIFWNAFSFRRKAGNEQGCPLLVKESYGGFDRFWYTHHLWIPAYLFMLLHAPKFYCWVAVPLLLFCLEKAISYWRLSERATIESAVLVSRDVLQLTIRKPGFRHTSGQYVKILVPELSHFVAHPFTVSSAPAKDVFSVHIRTGGGMDWTAKLRDTLFPPADSSSSYPMRQVYEEGDPAPLHVAVDGPFITSTQDYVNYDTAVLVGAGIGVTPFASILKSVVEGDGRLQPDKTYFYWMVSQEEHFTWFADIMNDAKSLQDSDKVEIITHLTGSFDLEKYTQRVQSGEAVPWSVQRTGRPDWKSILPKIVAAHTPPHPQTHRMGVFYCGPPEQGVALSSLCEKVSTPAVRVAFHREVF